MTRASAFLLLLALTLAGCGSDDPAPSCNCPGGTCDAAARCVVRLDTGAPLTCDPSLKPVGTSALASGVQRLGTFRVGETVAFDVPADTVSLTVVEQAVDAPDSITLGSSVWDNTAVPLAVRNPAGDAVFDDAGRLPADLSTLTAYFASDSPATGTLTIPNTTAALGLLSPGGLAAAGTARGWTLVVSDYAYECTFLGSSCTGGSRTSTYDVTVITKQAAGGAIPASGWLELAFYLVTDKTGDPSRPLPSAADAPRDPDLTRMVSTLATILGRAGVKVCAAAPCPDGRPPVTWHDVDPSVRQLYATGVDVDESGACAPLAQLLKLANTGAPTLNVFLVSGFDSVTVAPGSTVVGVDGTIPGPATIGGTVASGVAAATADLRRASRSNPAACAGTSPIDFQACGDDRAAYFVAHEAGHFLGLYHTTEYAGTVFDPIADSGACPCRSCNLGADACADASPPPPAGSEHSMTVQECTRSATCGGGDNLMFWLFSAQGSAGVLTPQQQSVVRANPLVQ